MVDVVMTLEKRPRFRRVVGSYYIYYNPMAESYDRGGTFGFYENDTFTIRDVPEKSKLKIEIAARPGLKRTYEFIVASGKSAEIPTFFYVVKLNNVVPALGGGE